MLSKDFLLLCDIVATTEPVSRAKWTYIFSSPDPKRYKQILKNSPSLEYTLPTWSELELMLLSADRPVSEWYDDFVLFGGVPRYIFSGKNSRNLLSTALNEKGRALAEWFFKFGFSMAEQCYMLVHINPPLSAEGDFNYSGLTVYTFASDAIFQLLVEKHRTQMLAQAVDMFNVGVASESYGKLFEKVCLWLKPLNGMCFTATSLIDDASNADFEVPSHRELLPQDWK